MGHSIVISSDLTNLNKVRLFLDEIFNESCLNRNIFDRVFLGLSEAVHNSIVHGNGLNEEKSVSVRIHYAENQLYIEVEDEGEGFPFDRVQDPTCIENLKKECGRGIFLIRHFADEVNYSEGGRKVLMRYRLS